MKRTIMYFALAMGIVTANAQENKSVKESNGSEEQPTLTKESIRRRRRMATCITG